MTNQLHKLTTAGALALALATAAAAADRPINETRKVDAEARISIENIAGTVTVTGWDRNEVQVTGTLDAKAESLEIDGGGAALSIEVKYARRRNLNLSHGSVLNVKVPRGCELSVETVSADIEVAEVRGAVAAQSVSGGVRVGSAPASVEAETVSGSLVVALGGGTVELATISGQIEATGYADRLETSTVSGSVELTATKPVKILKAESVSGSLEISASPSTGGDWDLACQSGKISIVVPANVDAEFDIETFSGDIRDEFGHEPERTSKYAPGSELNFTQGKGGAVIRIECFSGDVVIRKK
jgi:DUF4097 and DUF4098 domain-containing protein YvlB